MSIRSRLTAAFALCISLPMAAGVGALWTGSESMLRQSAGDDLHAAARTVMSGIETQLAMDMTHLKAWSSLPVMQDVLIGDEGHELAQAIGELNLSYADFTAIVVTDVQGKVVATTDAAMRGTDLSASDGVHAAVSGRVFQSRFTTPRAGSGETISLTVPLFATYDRQTVIGTMTGVLDLEAIARRVAANSPLAVEQRQLVLLQRDGGKVVFSSRTGGALSDRLKGVDVNGRHNVSEIVLGNESFLTAFVPSTGQFLERDPGLVAFGVMPSAGIRATADRLSGIFMSVAGIGAIGALILAWRWATPLVRVASSMQMIASGRNVFPVPHLPSHSTFSQMGAALEQMRAVIGERDRLAAREIDLITARETTETALREKSARLDALNASLKTHISRIVELCDLVSRENLLAASNKRHMTHAREISNIAEQLLVVVSEAIAQVPDEDKADTVPAAPEETDTDADAERRIA